MAVALSVFSEFLNLLEMFQRQLVKSNSVGFDALCVEALSVVRDRAFC